MNVASTEEFTGGTDLIPQVEPRAVLLDTAKFDEFFVQVKRAADNHIPDLSTEKTRAVTASIAHKISRLKNLIDKTGKEMNAEARAKINVLDKTRGEIWEKLEAVQTSVRAPLSRWEAEEDQRIEFVNGELSDLRGAPNYPRTWGLAELLEEIQALKARTFDPAKFQDQTDTAVALRDAAVLAMEAAHARLVKEEEDRAELERLRAEAAERKRQDDERAAKEEAERRRVAAAEAAEKRRAENEQAEKDRIAAAEKRAAENAKAEAERAHQAEIDRLNREAAEAERVRKAEADRLARIADEDAARAANRKHRTQVQAAAKNALMYIGADEELARKIVLAIIAGEVPAVTLRF